MKFWQVPLSVWLDSGTVTALLVLVACALLVWWLVLVLEE